MASNTNPGNFSNRPHEEVENIARKGGQSSHSGGFASMDPEKQVGFSSITLLSQVLMPSPEKHRFQGWTGFERKLQTR